MSLDEFLNLLGDRKLSESQLGNLRKLLELSRRFHRDAGISFPEKEIDLDSLVFESGHQPNYFPHSGTWRKAVLLDFLQKKVWNSVAFFGFADYNLCTASILYSNKIPALTKEGCVKIGFSLSKGDRWKTFDSIPKPSEQVFEEEINRMYSVYRNLSGLAKVSFSGVESNLQEIEEVMRRSYERAGNFPDMNAFIFSRICSELMGLRVFFFRYSDVQREGLFLEGWNSIIKNLETYNSTYNQVLEERRFPKISPLKSDFFPFWFRCDCGGNVALSVKESSAAGTCPVCKTVSEISLTDLESYFHRMSLSAVARNLVFSSGLGVSLYVSGSGGGLRYGVIADCVSDSLKFRKPVTLSWMGGDFYLGLAHVLALKGFMKTFGLSLDDLLDGEKLASRIRNSRDSLLEEIAELERQNAEMEAIQRLRGQYRNMETQTNIAKKVFGVVPSALDLFLLKGVGAVYGFWKDSLIDSEIQKEDGFCKIRRDINHPSVLVDGDEIPLVYGNICSVI